MFTVSIGMFVIVPTVHAVEDGEFTNPLKTPNPLTSTSTSEALAAAVQPWARIVRAIVGMLGTLMFVMLLWGGFQYMTAAGDPEKAGAGLKTVLWAALGGGVILASYVLAAWLIWPLGNIFGLRTGGLSSDVDGSANNKNGATFACCKFTVNNATRCKDITYATMKDCNSTSPSWTPNYPMVITGFSSPASSPAVSQNTTVQEIPGRRCADVPECSGSTSEPIGCCSVDDVQWNEWTAGFWGGVRCQDGKTRSECANDRLRFTAGKQCSEIPPPGYCNPRTLCCVFTDATKLGGYDCVANVQYDGTAPPGAQAACGALAQGRRVAEYGTVNNGACNPSMCTAQNTTHGQGGTNGNAGNVTSQKCCVPDLWNWAGWQTQRGTCAAPTKNANREDVCARGYVLDPRPCNDPAVVAACTEPQPNPPTDLPGCCYWKDDPNQALPMCTQRISSSLCWQDHRHLPKNDVWFRERNAPLEECAPKSGGVDCVAGNNSIYTK